MPHSPLLPLAPPHPSPLTPTEMVGTLKPPHPLGPQEAFGVFESLAALALQSDSEALFPLPPHSPSFPGPLKPPWDLRKPWEPSETFGSLGPSVRLRGLVPLLPSSLLAPPCPLSILGPQEALGAFGSLQQPWVFSQTQGPCSPYPLYFPGTSPGLRKSWNLWQP